MLPIVIGIVVIFVRGVGQSIDCGGGGVIGDEGIFGSLVIFAGVMIGFVIVIDIFVVALNVVVDGTSDVGSCWYEDI